MIIPNTSRILRDYSVQLLILQKGKIRPMEESDQLQAGQCEGTETSKKPVS
jgi:hypothetical protein